MLGLTPETALGKQVVINEGEAPVVGVVKDFNNNTLQEAITPCLLFYKGVDFFGEAGIKLKVQGDNLQPALATIENNWKQLFPESIYKYHFLDEALAKNYLVESLMSKAFQLFAGIAIFISCLGLLGLAVFATEQREREIGVRKVLGATLSSIVMLLSKDFLKPILIAIALQPRCLTAGLCLPHQCRLVGIRCCCRGAGGDCLFYHRLQGYEGSKGQLGKSLMTE